MVQFERRILPASFQILAKPSYDPVASIVPSPYVDNIMRVEKKRREEMKLVHSNQVL